MTLEEQLIKKAYFENYMDGNKDHPVRVLGELYLEENKKDIADLANIRFAQGEVYFHHKDFEAAIFKWENIKGEMEPWAKKNMADAYLELEFLDTAEGIYLGIESESVTLKIETGLQLLSIYIEQGKLDRATEVIKAAVVLDPDYPGVTEIARAFFEEHQDWDNSVKLASDEGVRTGAVQWFDILKTYIDAGYTKGKRPEYFNPALTALFTIDRSRFESLAVSLWKSYREDPDYLDWIKNFNRIFLDMDASRREPWRQLPGIYQETYFELINGTLLIKELSPLIPAHLTNWLKITDASTSLFASASVMAWSEMFPSSLSSEVVRDAEDLILNARRYPSAKEDSIQLFQSVIHWAEENGINPGHRIHWIIDELADISKQHLLLAGVSGSGKSEVINDILGETLMTGPTSSIVAFKYGDDPEILEITDTEIAEIANFEQFQEAAGIRRQNHKQETVIDFKIPNELLRTGGLALIDTPSINRNNIDYNPVFSYANFADSLLFVLNAEDPLTEREQEILMQIHNQAPDLPVHFLLNKVESLYSEQEAAQLVNETLARIHVFYPNAKLLTYAPRQNGIQLKELSDFIGGMMSSIQLGQERITKLQHFVRRSINYLLDKRIQMENDLVESVRWNEEMVGKLRGAINQVHDLEEEKAGSIKKSYLKIKDDTRAEILAKVPEILRGTSDLIKEDSDFTKLHLELNEEMNDRVQDYLENTVLKDYYSNLQEWITFSKEEFEQSQAYLDEMSEGFNAIYGEERIRQACDFKVLDDWNRDADRMTNGINIDHINFLNRATPSQFLLKSAGKLLGVLPQNHSMLYNKYKSYLENQDYQDTAATIAKRFFKHFEMFEKSIERDVKLFFKEPLIVLNDAVEEAKGEIETSKNALEKMRVNPEVYRDPLNLFEVKLRQYEWMTAAGKQDA